MRSSLVLVNCLFIRQQSHKALDESCYFFSKIGRNVHYVFLLSFRLGFSG